MKLTVKLDFGCGREIKVGTFSEIGRDTAFEFAGEFLSSGLDPAPFRLRAGVGLDRNESESILDCVIESCRNLVLHGVSGQD